MKKIIGTNENPRISIFRSNRFTSGQAIDDAKGATISSATTRKLTGNPSTGSTALTTDKLGAGTPIEKAVEAGQKLGENLKSQKISQVVFDRNGNKYHGNVAAFAEGIRRSGIKF